MQQDSWICLWTVMSLFCSMSSVAGCFLVRKITKHASFLCLYIFQNVFWKAREHLRKDLFCKSCGVTYYILLKMKFNTDALLEICRGC